MNESQYSQNVEETFLKLEDELETYDWDFDFENTGETFIIYNEDEEYIVITKNFANQEIWAVAGKDPFHFRYDTKAEDWISTRNKELSFFKMIHEYLNIISGIDK